MSGTTYTVAVRALCEFTAKTGDLDLRFTPSPSAQEGMLGHSAVTARRGSAYEREISLSGSHARLHVRGRADGYDPVANQLEEIKTFRGDLARQPANHRVLHWAQARVYGWLLCSARGLTSLRIALVYFDIVSQKETVFTETQSAADLEAFFVEQCARFMDWADAEIAHRGARDAALLRLAFPHQAFRPGQRELAEAVYRAQASGRCLMAQAPTGIGKTIATLFPLLKSMPLTAKDTDKNGGEPVSNKTGLDKIFYLAAKTPGRQLALNVLSQLTPQAKPLRILEMVAREKACEHPDKACHGDSCPLAQGFYDRLPEARHAAAAQGNLDRDALRSLAAEHAVCPYYLSQDMVRWADVIVADYNYYFDVSAMLFSLMQQQGWRVAVLVDEAHNLLERARKMVSAELDLQSIKALRKQLPVKLKKPFERFQRSANALVKAQQTDYAVIDELPESFHLSLQQLITATGDFFNDEPTFVDAGLQQFYFSVLQFQRLAEVIQSHSMFDLTLASARSPAGSAVLCVRNILPAGFLAPRLSAARTVTLFSATLSPWHFYADTLGLPENTAWIDVASPFDAAQLEVNIVPRISTRYQDRAGSLAAIAEVMARQFTSKSGNYLAFFSSYDYLQQVAEVFVQRYPQLPIWQQSRRMDEAAREAFLARFTEHSEGIGFAVLGGAFAEGIDLPGQRLIGAFIATLGLPQMNPVNEEICARMQQRFGSGYDYTYLYPGLQKVVQAAGRVIRTTEDRGVLVLMDDRYARAEVRALLPAWWRVKIDTSA